ncbi:7119_t:CDS:1, partial [Cetraspora pellucida]
NIISEITRDKYKKVYQKIFVATTIQTIRTKKMAAATLPETCLRKIFNSFNNLDYNISFKRSLVLINRYWCETLTPELW